jgi:DNA-binding transcriptional LysR family regulator
MKRPTQSAIVARKLGDVRSSLYAHQSYLQRYGTPLSEADLMEGHTLIGFDRETPFANLLASKFGVSRNVFALRTDNDLARLAMVRAAVGISFVPDRIAAREPAVVSLLPDIAFTLEMWLAMHEDQRGIARVRVIYDALAEAIAAGVASPVSAGDVRLS